MERGRERIIFIILGGSGFLLAVALQFLPAAYASVGLLIAIIALVLATLTFAVKDYAYLIGPIRHMKGRSIVLDANEPFYISSNSRCIVIRSGTTVYATSFIKIPIYKSSTEMTDEDKFNFATFFSRAISISTVPVRISSQLHMVNKDEYLQVITNRLDEAEDRYNNVLADKTAVKTAIDRVKGEVNMWHNLLDAVTKSNSQAQIAYATVTSSGESEDEAVNFASMNAEQISAGLSASLGVPTNVVNGNEILLFVEPEFLIPTNTAVDSQLNLGKSVI